MRLVSWNCKGAFHRKSALVEELRPDLLVVPECEELESITQTFGAKPLRSIQWIGDNPRKGLGVFAFGEYSIEVHPAYEPKHRWILPVRVSGPFSFTLLALWTVPHGDAESYVQPLVEALETYAELQVAGDVIWAGDFNANFRFDAPARRYKFRDFVAALSAKDIHSVYHREKNCAHGEENEKTFYMYHHAEKGHHIDYHFAGRKVRAQPHQLTIGNHEAWHKYSDHVPLTMDVTDGA